MGSSSSSSSRPRASQTPKFRVPCLQQGMSWGSHRIEQPQNSSTGLTKKSTSSSNCSSPLREVATSSRSRIPCQGSVGGTWARETSPRQAPPPDRARRGAVRPRPVGLRAVSTNPAGQRARSIAGLQRIGTAGVRVRESSKSAPPPPSLAPRGPDLFCGSRPRPPSSNDAPHVARKPSTGPIAFPSGLFRNASSRGSARCLAVRPSPSEP